MNVDRVVGWTCAAFFAASLCIPTGCATTPIESAEPPSVSEFGAVRVKFTTVDEADLECEQRIRNGKRHWGCATYRSGTCDIVVGDKDRDAVLGKELKNCVLMARELKTGQ
jgi:hypothetical protein